MRKIFRRKMSPSSHVSHSPFSYSNVTLSLSLSIHLLFSIFMYVCARVAAEEAVAGAVLTGVLAHALLRVSDE